MCGLRTRRDLQGPLPLHCPDGEMKIQRLKASEPSHKESSCHSCHQNLCLLAPPLSGAVAFCFITLPCFLLLFPERGGHVVDSSQQGALQRGKAQSRVLHGSLASQGGRRLLWAPMEPQWLSQSNIFP